MEKINFINNQAPALNATNLNQLQTNVENAIPTKVSELYNDERFLSRYSSIISTPFEYEIRNNTFILVIVHVNGGDLGAIDIVFKQNEIVYKTSLRTYPSSITISYTNEKVIITPQYTTAVSIVELIK